LYNYLRNLRFLCNKGWKFKRIPFFADRWLSRIKRKLGTREKNTYTVSYLASFLLKTVVGAVMIVIVW